MGRNKPLLLVSLLLAASLAGCIESSTTDSMIELDVEYASLNGTVVETYVDGGRTSNERQRWNNRKHNSAF